MKKSFSKKILAMCVATLFVAPSAFAADVVCDTPTGCNYKSTFGGTAWQINNDDKNLINEANLNLTVKAQNYQNAPLPNSAPEDVEPLIYVVGDDSKADDNAQLHIPTGTNITLDNQFQHQEAVTINNAKANIEQGVTVHIKPTQLQNQTTTPLKLNEYTEGGRAIVAYNDNDQHAKTVLNTSANIILDAAAYDGLSVAGLAVINANNHSITMNKPHNSALAINNGGEIVANNVTITGDQPLQFGVEIHNDSDFSAAKKKPTLTLNQSKITLSEKELSAGITGAFGEITVNDSNINARYGILPYELHEAANEKFNIRFNNSSIHGTGSLISSNPEELRELFPAQGGHYQDVNVFANNSTLKGKIDTSGDPKSRSKVNLTLNNNSSWEAVGAKSIDDIIMSGQGLGVDNLHVDKTSNVYISRSDTGYNTLNIHGDLTGEGNFYLRTEIADLGGDSIRVNGKVSGNHTLYALNSGGEPKDTSGKLRLVKTAEVASDDAFKLGNRNGVVEVGKYLYALKKDGTEWNLVYDNTQKQPENTTQPTQPVTPTQPSQPTNPTTPTQPTNPTQPTTPAQPTTPVVPVTPVVPSTPTTPTTPVVDKNFRYDLAGSLAHAQTAVLSAQAQNQALNEKQLALHQNQRLHGLWLQGETSHTKRKNSQVNGGNLSGFKDKTNTWQIGYDKEMGNGYAGVLAGQIRHNVDYHIDLYDDSKIRGNTFAVYGGLHGTNGWFMDGTLRHTRYSADSPQFERDRFRINSLNVQGGKNIALNETWTMVPNAALTIGRLSGSRLMQDGNLVQTQAGLDLQGKFALQNGVSFQPKVGAYYVGDHRGVNVAFNGENFRADDAGSRFAAKLGADVAFNKNNVLSANFRTEHGSKIKRPYQVDVGFRRSW